MIALYNFFKNQKKLVTLLIPCSVVLMQTAVGNAGNELMLVEPNPLEANHTCQSANHFLLDSIDGDGSQTTLTFPSDKKRVFANLHIFPLDETNPKAYFTTSGAILKTPAPFKPLSSAPAYSLTQISSSPLIYSNNGQRLNNDNFININQPFEADKEQLVVAYKLETSKLQSPRYLVYEISGDSSVKNILLKFTPESITSEFTHSLHFPKFKRIWYCIKPSPEQEAPRLSEFDELSVDDLSTQLALLFVTPSARRQFYEITESSFLKNHLSHTTSFRYDHDLDQDQNQNQQIDQQQDQNQSPNSSMFSLDDVTILSEHWHEELGSNQDKADFLKRLETPLKLVLVALVAKQTSSHVLQRLAPLLKKVRVPLLTLLTSFVANIAYAVGNPVPPHCISSDFTANLANMSPQDLKTCLNGQSDQHLIFRTTAHVYLDSLNSETAL